MAASARLACLRRGALCSESGLWQAGQRKCAFSTSAGTGTHVHAMKKLRWFQIAGGLASLTAGGIYLATHRSSEFYHTLSTDVVMPLIRLLDPERAHNVAVWAAANGLAPQDMKEDSEKLRVNLWNLEFSNPIGLGAGFDKHAETIDGLLDTGLSFVEVGSVTPKPQPGNPKPRVFRLSEDRGIINRYGFNSEGLEVVHDRLAERADQWDDEAYRRRHRGGILGLSIGKNKLSESAKEDYVEGIKRIGKFANYLVVNISSPNTPGLRDLQRRDALKELIHAVTAARDEVVQSEKLGRLIPLLVKIAPDFTQQEKEDVAAVLMDSKVDGLIVSNTTISRPRTLKSELKNETGGLSGAPVKEIALQTLRDMYKLLGGKIPIIGVGGIETGRDCYERIRAGASLVQVYSCLVYEGPSHVRKMKRELLTCLEEDGLENIMDAIGLDNPVP